VFAGLIVAVWLEIPLGLHNVYHPCDISHKAQQSLSRVHFLFQIKSVKLNPASGYAYVTFSDSLEADACAANMDGIIFRGDKLRVEVSVVKRTRF
jgi:RNA recognition motif-containing protein